MSFGFVISKHRRLQHRADCSQCLPEPAWRNCLCLPVLRYVCPCTPCSFHPGFSNLNANTKIHFSSPLPYKHHYLLSSCTRVKILWREICFQCLVLTLSSSKMPACGSASLRSYLVGLYLHSFATYLLAPSNYLEIHRNTYIYT